VVISVVLVAVVAAAVALIARRRPGPGILGSGVIEADEVRVAAKIPGRIERICVREGDRVEVGQLVTTLEHADIDAEVARAEGAVQAAAATLAELERGSRPEQIQAARARLAQAQAGRRGAERHFRTAQEAYAKVTELRQQVDAAQGRVRIADANIASAQATLDEARAGPIAEEIETRRAALRQAEARLEAARAAARDADEVYAHHSALETPLIAAATEESVRRADAGLAGSELARIETMAAEDAATEQSLDRARTQRTVADVRLAGATRVISDAREQVALTRAQAKQARDAAQSALQEAMRGHEFARAQLDVLLAGTREERIRLAEAALSAAKAEADAARDALRNATELYEDRLGARQQRDTAQASLESATALQDAAGAELELLLDGYTAEAIETARGRLAEARGVLKAANARRAYCDISAPCAGTVTDEVAEPGEVLSAGAPIVVLTDLDNMWLRAYLAFAELGRVKRGQKLRVVTEAVPGRVFEGDVTRISDEAEFTPKDVQTAEQRVKQVYWIKIGLGDGDGLLKPGMPADVLR
jgi:HlyD family secretion protein